MTTLHAKATSTVLHVDSGGNFKNEFGFDKVGKIQMDARESPILMCVGVNSYWSLQADGSGTLSATSMTLYENGTDVSSTKLSGSLSVSGRTIKTKSIDSVTGGNYYRAFIYYTDGGASQVREFSVFVPRLGESPSRFASAQNIYRVDESPIVLYPGQAVTFSMVVEGQGVISASPTMSAYRGIGNDVSSTVLSSSTSVSGRTITLKAIGSLTYGSYIVYVFFTDNGRATWRYFEVLCPNLGA